MMPLWIDLFELTDDDGPPIGADCCPWCNAILSMDEIMRGRCGACGSVFDSSQYSDDESEEDENE